MKAIKGIFFAMSMTTAPALAQTVLTQSGTNQVSGYNVITSEGLQVANGVPVKHAQPAAKTNAPVTRSAPAAMSVKCKNQPVADHDDGLINQTSDLRHCTFEKR